jgi:hypothetical protein
MDAQFCILDSLRRAAALSSSGSAANDTLIVTAVGDICQLSVSFAHRVPIGATNSLFLQE